MKLRLLIICFLVSIFSYAQQNTVSLHSFYKDHLYANKSDQAYNEGSFLPVLESDYDVLGLINDSAPMYYKVTNIIFQKHLIEINAKDCYLTISPLANLFYGRDLGDTSGQNITQNTRGVIVEGDLFKKFSFATSFYENQSRFMRYETAYYESLGERYIGSDSLYAPQNAVVPGAGRTKPFKTIGFDYAYATGYFAYSPIKQLQIIAGNNQQFIGDGHRSLLLSDNSYNAPYLRVNWKMHSKWSIVYHRSRLINLLRRPEGSSAESYYEPKGFSVNYFTYKPNRNISISLFEGGVWNRGDSIESKFSHPLYYNPVPFVSSLILSDGQELSSLHGLNIGAQLHRNHRVYGQLALTDFNAASLAFQVGYRGYRFFGLNDLMLQMEYNYVPSSAYQARSNNRLNYSHYHLPLAHVKGSGFQELILRMNYEIERVYFDIHNVLYWLQDYQFDRHLPIPTATASVNGNTFFHRTEIGYRMNRKINLDFFVNWTFRSESGQDMPVNAFGAGLRTGLTNHYNDF